MVFVVFDRRMFISCLSWIPLMVLTGCSLSMSKEEREQNILQTPSIRESITQALDSSFFTASEWPKPKWWEEYGSMELNGLIERALAHNPSIQAVQQKIEFAKSQAVIARSNLFPLIYFDASDQLNYFSQTGLYKTLNPDIPSSSGLIDFSLSFSYEFDFWSKYRNLYKAALGREKAAMAEVAQAELITAAAVAQSYFALKTNLLRKVLYDELYQVRKRYFELQTLLLQNALRAQFEPLLSQEAVFEAQQWVYNIEQEIAVDIHIVNILAGQSPDEPLALEEKLLPLNNQLALPSELSIQLLARRPDLMTQIWQVDALAHEVGAAKADFWPDINLTGLLGFQSFSWGNIFQWISKTTQLMPAFSLPLYTAGATGANVTGKKALFHEAVYRYNDLILQSFQQVADLMAIGRAVYGKKEQQSGIVANASRRYDLMELLQQKGIDNALSSYLFLEELLQKKLADVELLYQQYVVSVNFTKVLGGGYVASSGAIP